MAEFVKEINQAGKNMLISPDSRIIVSNLGWVDKSALWTYDIAKDKISLLSVGNAKYLTLFPCQDKNLFMVFHNADNASLYFAVHSFDNPASPLGTIEYSREKIQCQGNIEVLKNIPRYFVIYYDPGYNADFHLVSIDPSNAKIQTERFVWYDNSYDKGYQGIVGVFELDSGNLIVSVQRDSHPVIYDPKEKRVIGKLSLANRNGNPTLRYAKHRQEIWADDYDTILKFDSNTLTMKDCKNLQPTLAGTTQFIGNWYFNNDESLCFISRPFSGDVIAISTENLKTKYVAQTGKQPLESVVTKNGDVYGRDWKTGILLKGTLKRKLLG